MAHDYAGILLCRKVPNDDDRSVLCLRSGRQQDESGETHESAHLDGCGRERGCECE